MRSGYGCISVLMLVITAVAAPAADEGADPESAPSSADSSLANPTEAHRWHLPRRNARDLPRHDTESHPDDWNPLAKPAGIGKTFLRDHRVTTDLFVMFFDQYASKVREGQHNYGTFAWRSVGDVALVKKSRMGASYLEWDMNGTLGLNYDQAVESLSSNGGHHLRRERKRLPHSSAMDELFWKQLSPRRRPGPAGRPHRPELPASIRTGSPTTPCSSCSRFR